MEQSEFMELLVNLSDAISKNDEKYVDMLRVLYTDLVVVKSKLEKAKSAFELFQLLIALGILSPTDISVLFETVELTGLRYLKEIIEKYERYPDEVKISRFSAHRQRIVGLGKGLSVEDVQKLSKLYGVKVYSDPWKLIRHLEYTSTVLTEDNMPSFTQRLRDINVNEEQEVPANILARGPDALKVYQAVLEEGKSDFNLVGLMVMGQENVGKTCLINSLLGKKFTEIHIITDVIAMTSLVCDEVDNTKWKEKEIDYRDQIQMDSSKTLGPNGDRKRKNSNDEASGNKETKRSKTNTDTIGETSQVTLSASTMEDNTQPKMIDANVIEKIVQIMKGKSKKDNSLRIWDYGGQLIYQSILRFYLTPERIFLIVFNMFDKLDDYSKVVDSSGNEHIYYMTNLEYLLYFIRLAYTYTKGKVCYTDDLIDFPVFIIVGTHWKSLTESEVKEKFAKIRKAIGEQVYKSNVYKTYFAVDNTLAPSDKSFIQLKEAILEIKGKMNRPIPYKWLDLLIAIQKLREENITLPLQQVESMARECGISDKTIDVAITYFSDVGEIMYHPTEEALKDIVVIQPMKVAEYVKPVFTIVKPEQKEPKLIDDWKRLEEGVLTKRLLKHLWDKFPIFQNDTDEKMFNFFVKLMNKFGLICQVKNKTDSDDIACYAVSHLYPTNQSVSSEDDQPNDKVSIFHDFCGFLPDYLFQLVVIRFIEEFQMENGHDTELAYEQTKLSIDDHHYVRIAVVTINYRRMVKTTIVRRRQPNASCAVELLPETCKKVLSFLQRVLEVLCSARGIQYKMCIPCSCTDKCQQMHVVENFNKDTVSCGSLEISIARYCRLFGDRGASMLDKVLDKLSTAIGKEDEHLDMLRVLYTDLANVKSDLVNATSAFDLFQLLIVAGILTPADISVLFATIELTGMNYLKEIIEKYERYPDEVKITQFSAHRQCIVALAKDLSVKDLQKVRQKYEIPDNISTNPWKAITFLENKGIIKEDNLTSFIMNVKTIDLTAKVVDSTGGDLEFQEIKLHIPAGAIAEGEHVDVSLELLTTDECDVPFANKLESRVSSIVSCRPSGTVFKEYCTLSFPYNAINEDSWEFSVFLKKNFRDNWKIIECDDENTKVSIQDGRCCIKTKHFSLYALKAAFRKYWYVNKRLIIGAFGKMLNGGYYQLRVRLWSEHDYELVSKEETILKEKDLVLIPKPILVKYEDMDVSLSGLCNGWKVDGKTTVTLKADLMWDSYPSHAFHLNLNDASIQSSVATIKLTQGSCDVDEIHVHIDASSSTAMDTTHPSSDMDTLDAPHPSSDMDTLDAPHPSSDMDTLDAPHPSSDMDTLDAPHPSSDMDTLDAPHPSSDMDTLDAPHPSSDMDTTLPTSAMDIQHTIPATRAPHTKGPICIQGMTVEKFSLLKVSVSEWYDDRKCLPMLKLLFRDHLDNQTQSKISGTMDLLNALITHGYLDWNNLDLLCDIISITKHFGLQQRIKDTLPSFPAVKEGTIPKQFTDHRQKLMKFVMKLTPADVGLINGFYNAPLKKYTDNWNMIADLEDRWKIMKGKMEEFIHSLETLDISPALNALKSTLH